MNELPKTSQLHNFSYLSKRSNIFLTSETCPQMGLITGITRSVKGCFHDLFHVKW